MSKSIGNVVDPDVVVNGGEVSQTLVFLRITCQNFLTTRFCNCLMACISLYSCLAAELQKTFLKTLATLQFCLAEVKTLCCLCHLWCLKLFHAKEKESIQKMQIVPFLFENFVVEMMGRWDLKKCKYCFQINWHLQAGLSNAAVGTGAASQQPACSQPGLVMDSGILISFRGQEIYSCEFIPSPDLLLCLLRLLSRF